MSGAVPGDESVPSSSAPQRVTPSYAAPPASDAEMPSTVPADFGGAASSATGGRRQSARAPQPQAAAPVPLVFGSHAGASSPDPQLQAQHHLPGYSQQMRYQWFQPQRSGPYQQGQLTPYGWLPYNLSYQVFGEQAGGQAFYESQVHSQVTPYHQIPFQGQHEMPHYAVGRGTQGYMQHPFLPQMMQVPMGRGRPARVRSPAEESPDSYNFNITEACERPEQARKTLMLRNIPNKYTIHMLLEMLDKCHKRGPNDLVYDFCYLPIDFKNRCNLGYAFVNFVDAASTAECYAAFNAKRWNDFNSKKVCEVKYARVQGKDALVEHFRNSKFPSNDIDCLPLLFEKVTLESGEETVRSVPLHSRQGS